VRNCMVPLTTNSDLSTELIATSSRTDPVRVDIGGSELPDQPESFHVSPDRARTPVAFANELAFLRPQLLRRALSLSGRRELAEDLVQGTLEKALQAHRSFTPGTNLQGWLSTILRNEFYSYGRRAWRSAEWSAVYENTIASSLGEQQASVDLSQVACALNWLPDDQREALVIIGLLGFSYAETAILLHSTIGTIKSRISRARMALMQILGSRASARIHLQPETPRAFDLWLAALEKVRNAANTILLQSEAFKEPRLPKVPRVRIREQMREFIPYSVDDKPDRDRQSDDRASVLPEVA
jgi:RNA polymerase sigma-70 factor, ECF subfamily